MGNRLSKIYTRTGDDGTTGLADGSRLNKHNRRIHLIGDIDELNCCVGIVLTEILPDPARQILVQVQHHLFDLGGELAISGHDSITNEHVARLESEIDSINRCLPPLREFILPGGSKAAAFCHMARAICRRAERQITALNEQEPVNPNSLHYINRLSDLLFVLARFANTEIGHAECYWNSQRIQNDQ